MSDLALVLRLLRTYTSFLGKEKKTFQERGIDHIKA